MVRLENFFLKFLVRFVYPLVIANCSTKGSLFHVSLLPISYLPPTTVPELMSYLGSI